MLMLMQKKSLLSIGLIFLTSLIMLLVMSGCEAFNVQDASVDQATFNYNANESSEDGNDERGVQVNDGSDITGIISGEKLEDEKTEGVGREEKDEEEEGEGGEKNEPDKIESGKNEKESINPEIDENKDNNKITSEHAKIKDDTDLFIEIYYQDIKGLVIPVARRIPKQLSVAKSAVNGLIDTPMNRESMSYYGLIPILPKGTEFTINIIEKTAIIDFNEKILEYDNKKSEQNIVSSIVYTLTQFDSIDKVKILINGYEEEKLKYGTDISQELSRDDVLINSPVTGKVNLQEGMSKWDIYLLKYVKNTGILQNSGISEEDRSNLDSKVFLVPVSVEFSKKDADSNEIADMVLEFLSIHEMNSEVGLFSVVNNSIVLNKITIEGDLLTLDMNIDINNYGGSYNEYFMVNQILYSMKQFKGPKKINVLVGGEAISLPEGTDLSLPVSFPDIINNTIDEEEYF